MGRIENDAFYTPDNIARSCVEDFYNEKPEYKGLEVVEPSAGGGAFIRALESQGIAAEGYDLKPTYKGIRQFDFLEQDLNLKNKIVIGNPPYGYVNTLTKKFVKRSFEQGAEAVGFLLFSGVLTYTHLKSIGRKVEYYKRIDSVNFLDETGKIVLKAYRGSYNPVFIVWSKDDFQDIQYPVVEYANDSDYEWYANYGGIKARTSRSVPYRYTNPGKKNPEKNTWVFPHDPNRISVLYKSIENRFEKEHYESIYWTSLGGRVVPNSLNFHASNPGLYKGWIE